MQFRLSRLLLTLDDWRVRQHFKRVERELRAHEASHLPGTLQTARARHLDELHRYAARGIFPRNHERPGHAPCFIDHDGRECAVAHLVMADGRAEAAYRIAGSANYAYVPDMRFPELDAWAAQSGLSKEELARIQPSYVYDPELRELLPRLLEFAFSLTATLWTVQIASVAGVIVSAVNIATIRRRRAGSLAAVIGLGMGVVLLLLAVSIATRMLAGTELLLPFSNLQPPMVDFEISFARSAYQAAWGWSGAALLLAGLCIVVSAARLVMNRQAVGDVNGAEQL
jgi:hypothetical protein